MNLLTIFFSLSIFNADFAICTANDNQDLSSAIYKNNQYYVFWEDARSYPLYSLYGARISITGSVVDPDGKLLFRDSVYSRPAVAYDGTNFLVVFRDGC